MSKYGLPTIRSAKTASSFTPSASFKIVSSCIPNASISFKSCPLILIPIGARIPVCSITNRVSIGCNFGADVTPGNLVTFTISFQMSSGDCISGRQFR